MKRLLIAILLIGILALNLGPILGADVTDNVDGNPSKAYYGEDASNVAWGSFSTGEFGSNKCPPQVGPAYAEIAASDSTLTNWSAPNNCIIGVSYPYNRFDFNVSKIADDNNFSLTDITMINVRAEGYGKDWGGGVSYLFKGALKNDDAGTWITSDSGDVNGTWSHTNNGSSTLSIDIDSNIGDYISSAGLLKFVVRGPEGDAVAGASLYVDYVYVTVTYYEHPSVPVPVTPTTGSTISTTGITLDWNASTGGTAPITYDVMLDNNALFSSPDVNVTAHVVSNYTVSGLTSGTWYWKVNARDSNATPVLSTACATQTFTVSLPSGDTGGGGTPYVPTDDLNLSAITIDAGNENLPGWAFLENPLVRAGVYIFLIFLVLLGLIRNRVDLALVSAGIIFFSWITRLGDRLNFQNLSFQAKTLSMVDFQLGNAEWNIPVWVLFTVYLVFAAIIIEWLWPYLHRKRMDKRTKDVAWRYAVGTLAVCMFLYYSGFRIG